MITLLIIETSTIVLICVIISAQLSSPPIGRLNFLVGWHPKVLTGTSLSANSLEKNDDWDYGCNYHVNGHIVAYMQKMCGFAEKAILAKKKLRKKCVNRDKSATS